ncbi:hypothetical protein HETIRDRAFT_421768 [Heterobasidion irregulare TC 32-1]|uniref:Uncharacterized protein n=1 Tax=Heterobasidion irregulare (strain TC 32-1) TaxID=747525 RepID=W4JTU5_HETIT|nr:uncharacterized protein HETIRDRAFT_421768 [Heterobasidion irregulare TC 32-1]ETW76281.1 hypothetical protein HETIRDRAFT_421768 [Heterobasidion irregulare TC 32-1]
MSPSTRLSKPIDYLLVDDHNKRREVRTVLVNANILDPKPMGSSKNSYAPLGATLELLTELVQEDMLKKWLINFDPDDILFYEPTDPIPTRTVRTRSMDEYRAMMNDGSLCQKQDEIREYIKAPGGGGRVVSFLVQVGRILEGPISSQHGSTESKRSTGLPGEEPWYWNRLVRLEEAVKRSGPPSKNAKASSYVKYQRGFARVIDGRSSIAGLDNRAPSIELYHPVFA